jgi:hypothetical protein
VITAVYARTVKKYGTRGRRYVELEAGHAAQNVLLQAVALGLAAVPIGGFDDQHLAQALRLPSDRISAVGGRRGLIVRRGHLHREPAQEQSSDRDRAGDHRGHDHPDVWNGQGPPPVNVLVGPRELYQSLEGPTSTNPALLDVRWQLGGPPDRSEYEAVHIPGAVFVDLDAELAAPPGRDAGPAGRGHAARQPDLSCVFDAPSRILSRAGAVAGTELVEHLGCTSGDFRRAPFPLAAGQLGRRRFSPHHTPPTVLVVVVPVSGSNTSRTRASIVWHTSPHTRLAAFIATQRRRPGRKSR